MKGNSPPIFTEAQFPLLPFFLLPLNTPILKIELMFTGSAVDVNSSRTPRSRPSTGINMQSLRDQFCVQISS